MGTFKTAKNKRENLLYATERCPVNKTEEKSLEFAINRVLMKIFQTKSIDTIHQCRW